MQNRNTFYIIVFILICAVIPAAGHDNHGNDSISEAMRLLRSVVSGAEDRFMTMPNFLSYRKYDRYAVALNKIAPKDSSNLFLRTFSFLREYIDTSEVSGSPILPVVVREKSSQVYQQNSPYSKKSVVHGTTYRGLDHLMDQHSLQAYYEDAIKEVDIYDDYITLLHYRFASPFSSRTSGKYDYAITDTTMIDSVRCIELSFSPNSKKTLGFFGRAYIADADSAGYIRRVNMYAPCADHISYIDRIFINQDFTLLADGTPVKTYDDLTMEVDFVKRFQDFYARRTTVYSDYSSDISLMNDPIFSKIGDEFSDPEADRVNELFWYSYRPIGLRGNERNIKHLSRELHSHPVYDWSEKLVKFLLDWYIPTGKRSKFDIGPVNDFYEHNSVEGLRLGLGGMTTSFLSPHFFIKATGGYGFGDHEWKYSGEVEYSFTPKRYHAREFPVNSLRLAHSYGVDRIGHHYEFHKPGNLLSIVKRMDDKLLTYRRTTSLAYTRELRNHLSFEGEVSTRRLEAARWTPFTDGFGVNFTHYTQNMLKLKVRFAPGEKFLQWRDSRTTFNYDSPVFVVSHTVSPRGFLGNHFTINYSEIGYRQRFWFRSCGYADVLLKGGHVWSRVAYPDLCMPNANISYTVQPESFSLLNPMEFVSDTYGMWDLTYYLSGLFLHHIPILKRMDIREVVSCRGYLGYLSGKNDPSRSPEVFRFPSESHTTRFKHGIPYIEASVGLENILSILRIDYVWRLTYRNASDISRGGIRLALYIAL